MHRIIILIRMVLWCLQIILTEPTTDSISIPISKGYVNGNISYFVTTDASEKGIVSSVTNTSKFSINYAPSLAGTPQSSRQQGYVFTNGVKGEGPFGFQLSVASATPANGGYRSPIWNKLCKME